MQNKGEKNNLKLKYEDIYPKQFISVLQMNFP